MAFQPAHGLASAILRFDQITTSEFLGVNTLHFRKGTGTDWDVSELQTLAEDLETWFVTEREPITGNNCRLSSITCRDLGDQVAPQFVLGTNHVGNQASELLPYNVTIAISFRTGLTGRSQMGRNFIVGMCETQTANSQVTTAYGDAIIACYEEIPTYVGGDNFHHVILSRWLNGVKRTVAVGFDVNTYVLTDRVTDSMRRRLPGRGQ